MPRQIYIILNINSYLKAHNLPVRFNFWGVCNGLAAVYAKYVLENRVDEFNQLIKQASNISKYDNDDEINRFIGEVIIAMEPHLFDKSTNQNTAYQLLTLRDKGSPTEEVHKMTSIFEMSMIGSQKSWSSLIKDINLRGDETILISSPNHAMAIRKKDGVYYFYDPNENKEIQFTSEKKLIKFLAKGYFKKWLMVSQDIALNIRVVSDTSKPKRMDLPDRDRVEAFISENIDKRGKFGKFERNNLEYYAAESNTKLDMDYIYTNSNWTSEECSRAALQAIAYNNHNALRSLLPAVHKDDYLNLYFNTLFYGRQACFDVISSFDKGPNSLYQSVFVEEETRMILTFLASAAEGGNTHLLSTIISDIKKNTSIEINADLINTSRHHYNEDEAPLTILQHAIKSNNAKCLSILLRSVTDIDAISINQKLAYLAEAIKNNHPKMTKLLIKEFGITSQMLNRIRIPIRTFQKTDGMVLDILKTNGKSFDEIEEKIYQKKINMPKSSIVLSIGIMLLRFTDFVRGKNKITLSDKASKKIGEGKQVGPDDEGEGAVKP